MSVTALRVHTGSERHHRAETKAPKQRREKKLPAYYGTTRDYMFILAEQRVMHRL